MFEEDDTSVPGREYRANSADLFTFWEKFIEDFKKVFKAVAKKKKDIQKKEIEEEKKK